MSDRNCCDGKCHQGRKCPRYEQEDDFSAEAATGLLLLVVVMVGCAFLAMWP